MRFRGIICERCGVEVTRSKVRRERMGHIELAAPVVHIWYLRGTRSWLAYLLMGTEAREELKAKQLEKVIYFAANLVTWVDEAKRHEDLPELEAELGIEIAEIEKKRDVEIDRRFKALEAELAELEKGGAKDAEIKARQRDVEKEIAGVRERYQDEIELAQRSFDEFRSLHSRKILEDEMLWRELRFRYEDYFEGGMGAETISRLIDRIDLDAEESQAPRDDRRGRRAQAPVGAAPPEGHQAAQDRHRLQPPRRERPPGQRSAGHDPRLGPGDPARPAPHGAARRRPVRHLRPQRPVPAGHQPQQPAEAPPRPRARPRSSSTTRSGCSRRRSTPCSTTGAAAGR